MLTLDALLSHFPHVLPPLECAWATPAKVLVGPDRRALTPATLAVRQSLEGDYRGGAHVHKTGARLVAIGDIHGDYEQVTPQ